MVHKLNTEWENFKWQEVCWLQNRKSEKYVLNYKNTLEEPFKTLSFLRKGNSGKSLNGEKNIMNFYQQLKKKWFTGYARFNSTNISLILLQFENYRRDWK